MNVLVVPSEHESFALQRFLNLAVTSSSMHHYKLIGDVEYGAFPNDGAVYLTYDKKGSKQRDVWELIVPQAWHDKPEYDEYRGVMLTDEQFVYEFHDFIEDFRE
jgi:hypothetical protein